MTRLGMLIELDRCIGCKACVTACKERWDSGPGVARDWVHELERGTREAGLELTFFPGLCNHCDAHPCTSDCPTGATYADESGVVRGDRDLCIGCGNCVPMCPYGARQVDAAQGIVEKCNLCAPHVARGEEPACVATCLAECRHFGDLDAPGSKLAQLVERRAARPLVTETVNIGPQVYYAPEAQRRHILASGAVKTPETPWLTELWSGTTRPLAQYAVPAVAAAAALGGLIVNFRSRGNAPGPHDARSGAPRPQKADGAARVLKRHRLGMRVLHWFNAASWLLLLSSGTALMVSPRFALFGTALPKLAADLVGGAANLLYLHVVWGLFWAAVTVPFFLYYKRFGIEAVREVWLTRDDFRWLLYKPMALLGVGDGKLPPQDKYNAGQKLFAVSVLLATAGIIASGLVMSFHLGPAWLVAAAILGHKLSIILALLGLGVHLTMAIIMRDERPALYSMVRGDIDYDHAATHAEKWVTEVENRDGANAREDLEEVS